MNSTQATVSVLELHSILVIINYDVVLLWRCESMGWFFFGDLALLTHTQPLWRGSPNINGKGTFIGQSLCFQEKVHRSK